MSDDYIRREAALDACFTGWGMEPKDCAENIRKIPAADVVEVRRGRWSLVEARRKESVYRCSECGSFFAIRADTLNGGRGDMSYCPNCGAKMDGGQSE